MNESELLRRAVNNEPLPRDLRAKVRTRLARRRFFGNFSAGFSGWGRLASSLAMLVVIAGGLQISAVQKTRGLLRTGLDDHIQCAIAGAYPRQTGQAAMIQALGPYSPMLQPILDQAPGDSVVSAHRCTINGRIYVHMILRRGNTLISVILTKRGKDDGFPRMMAARLIRASGIPLHEGNLDGYSVAGFQAGSYLGYVVSGLPAAQNDALVRRVAPVVIRYTGA